MKTAESILMEKGFNHQEANEIIDQELDLKVRELYNVQNHPIHLWDKYSIGDANEEDILIDAESNTLPISKYNDIDDLFNDMTEELENLSSEYQYESED